MIDEENMKIMLETIELELNMFRSSYHGPNCRYCNRYPSFLRRCRWRIEDFINMLRYGREPKELYRLDQYFEQENDGRIKE